MMTIIDFVRKYDGKFIEADGSTPGSGYYRQCVDVAKQWCRVIGIHRIPAGDANRFNRNADCKNFVWIKNEVSNFPLPGDIVQFRVGSSGHVGVVISADQHSLRVFEQNSPRGYACRTHVYDYQHPPCTGWLRPIIR